MKRSKLVLISALSVAFVGGCSNSGSSLGAASEQSSSAASAQGQSAPSPDTWGDGWYKPAGFATAWNRQASRPYQVAVDRAPDPQSGDELIWNSGTQFAISYSAESRAFSHLADQGDDLQAVVQTCAQILQVLDPKLSESDSFEVMKRAALGAKPIGGAEMDNFRLQFARTGMDAGQCYFYPKSYVTGTNWLPINEVWKAWNAIVHSQFHFAGSEAFVGGHIVLTGEGNTLHVSFDPSDQSYSYIPDVGGPELLAGCGTLMAILAGKRDVEAFNVITPHDVLVPDGVFGNVRFHIVASPALVARSNTQPLFKQGDDKGSCKLTYARR